MNIKKGMLSLGLLVSLSACAAVTPYGVVEIGEYKYPELREDGTPMRPKDNRKRIKSLLGRTVIDIDG